MGRVRKRCTHRQRLSLRVGRAPPLPGAQGATTSIRCRSQTHNGVGRSMGLRPMGRVRKRCTHRQRLALRVGRAAPLPGAPGVTTSTRCSSQPTLGPAEVWACGPWGAEFHSAWGAQRPSLAPQARPRPHAAALNPPWGQPKYGPPAHPRSETPRGARSARPWRPGRDHVHTLQLSTHLGASRSMGLRPMGRGVSLRAPNEPHPRMGGPSVSRQSSVNPDSRGLSRPCHSSEALLQGQSSATCTSPAETGLLWTYATAWS